MIALIRRVIGAINCLPGIGMLVDFLYVSQQYILLKKEGIINSGDRDGDEVKWGL